MTVREQIDPVGAAGVRTLVADPRADGDMHVVIVPGLGALGYLLPTVRALAARGLRCTLLDLPGFGTSRPRPGPPTLAGVAACAASWLRSRPARERLVLAGHSTGAQSALLAGLAVQDDRELHGVVLAGPTVAPSQRGLARLVAIAPAAYRRDSPRELVVLPDYLRARTAVVELLRSGIADRPERNVAGLHVPLLLTAGTADAFAPRDWLSTLARCAVSAPSVRTVVLPGSHNNPWTHPDLLADLVTAFARAPG